MKATIVLTLTALLTSIPAAIAGVASDKDLGWYITCLPTFNQAQSSMGSMVSTCDGQLNGDNCNEFCTCKVMSTGPQIVCDNSNFEGCSATQMANACTAGDPGKWYCTCSFS